MQEEELQRDYSYWLTYVKKQKTGFHRSLLYQLDTYTVSLFFVTLNNIC